ncbi:MAG: IS4 family transposase [Beijerinckiaceae bacterium]
MASNFVAALASKLSPHVGLGKTRLETLCLLIVGVISARTVNLSHLASERAGPVRIASTYRRLQRFFQHVKLPEDWAALVIMRLLGLKGSWYLCLDRTNWKIGRSDVNLLVLAVVTSRLRVPLMWTVLSSSGNSSTEERIDLMRRYLALFGARSIRVLLADREFIGLTWLNFLARSKVPFAIRVRETLMITTEQGKRLDLRSLLAKCRGPRRFTATLEDIGDNKPLTLGFAAKRIKGGELLIIASNLANQNILAAYRKRWAIECLFGDTKTRGLNLEDTRLVMAHKLSLLMAVAALAIAWTAKVASNQLGQSAPPRKPHGYYAKSWFRTGFDELRRAIRTHDNKALRPWAIKGVV